MAADVFVSYSRRDAEAVGEVADRLRQAGVSVWLDRSGIEGAARWREEIVAALQACRVVVLFLSPSAAASDNVAKEISLASEDDKPILPVHLAPVQTPHALRYQLAGVQHIEWHRGEPADNFRALTRALARLGVLPSDERANPGPGGAVMPGGVDSRLGAPPRVYRRPELHDALLGAVRGSGSRLAIQGLPGIGKTALLCDLARAVGDEFAATAVVRSDGPASAEPAFWLADLNAAATAVGCGLPADVVDRQPPQASLNALAARLTDRPVLILIDGAGEDGRSEELLGAFGRIGRARVVAGVRRRPDGYIPSVAVPPLSDPEAVSFASHVAATLSLDIDPAEVVPRLPAAVRSHPQALATLLAQLGDLPLDLLLEAGLTEESFAPVRLVRQVIENLDEPTRRVLGLVAVLSGLNLSAALKTLGIAPTPTTLKGLQTLLARSLIYRTGEAYAVPELVRVALAEADPVAWAGALGETATGAGRAVAAAGGVGANVGSAATIGCGVVQALAASGQWYQIGKVLPEPFLELLNTRGYWKEYAFLLRHAGTAAARTGDRRPRVRLGCRLARKLIQTGDPAGARAAFREAEAVGADPGSLEQAELHSHRGLLHQIAREEAEALSEWEASRRIREQLGDRTGLAAVERMMGELHLRRAEHDRARALLDSALAVLREGEDFKQVLEVETSLAVCDLSARDFAGATRRLEDVIRRCGERGYEPGRPRALLTLAMVELAQGRNDRAAELAEQAAAVEFDQKVQRSARFLLGRLRDRPPQAVQVDPIRTAEEYEQGRRGFTDRLNVEWGYRVDEFWKSMAPPTTGQPPPPPPPPPPAPIAAAIADRLREFCVLNGRDLIEVDAIEQERAAHYSAIMSACWGG